ncbi:FAD/NAD(P)-binding protein [Mangrovihabitans endophyticus]|uniref:FAD-dependent urate hydroxylase HpyO/Asp monooxygenase CreE-like FAD/NAD(P)-binding domain-containing protein n=1 Tax=Mangrovihabitans endophyticus TaxID=1751298 RepID=A0A8J3FML4_9ACTN|nr:FAD/NAD(P)-binding protein [Mangrovihabitans endophyticus]GGK74059.1 hypothetical protein GCM10012284_05050 [Mangrovihabitans endophyticus]
MPRICIVGAGPRGLSVLERVCAHAGQRPSERVRVHVADPHVHRGSAVWRTDQSRLLLMNTIASQITMFTDDSVELTGPVVPGPSLYDWSRTLLDDPDADPDLVLQAKDLLPDGYPSRVLYGHYLGWFLRGVVERAPANVEITRHAVSAVELLDEAHGGQTVVLADGVRLTGLDAVVLAQGHLPTLPPPEVRRMATRAAAAGVRYLPPANPALLDLSVVRPGAVTVLRGMGLTFFDYLALLTEGRGGIFTPTVDGGLAYRPSGNEPVLYAGSRRGLPYHSRGENQKGVSARHEPRFLTPLRIAGWRARAATGDPPDFRAEVWPLISAEVRAVYYHALIASRLGADAAAVFAQRYAAVAGAGDLEAPLLAAWGVAPGERWSWDALAHPWRGQGLTDQAGYERWLLGYLRRDLAEARLGNVSGPLKSALDAMRDLRNEIRLVVDHSGIEGASYRDGLQSWYTPLNAFLSIGPPPRRIAETVALLDAGVLHMLGPEMQVRVAGDAFAAWSRVLPGTPVRAEVLIEARQPEFDLHTTTDPLLCGLYRTGRCTPYRIAGRRGIAYETGGLAVTTRPCRLVEADGRAHPSRFAFGIPTEAVHWVTAAGIRPGVNSVTLADADAIARQVVRPSPEHALSGSAAKGENR